MARVKTLHQKIRRARKLRENRPPAVWVLLKKFGIGRGRRVPLMRLRRIFRNWRRRRLKI